MKLPQPPLLAQIASAHWISHLHIMVLPALMPLIADQRGISFVEIGFALGVFNVVSACVQTPIGFAVDRLGPRRTLIAGITLGSLCFLSLGLFASYGWMLTALAIAGAANAVYHPSDYALLSRGIDESRMGRAFAVHTFAGFLGTALAPAILLAVASFAGINSAFVVSGLLGLAIVPMLLTEREPPLRAAKPRQGSGAPKVRVFGIVTTGFNIGGAAGPVAFGWLLDQGYPHAIFWAAVIFMLVTAAMTLVQEIRSARRDVILTRHLRTAFVS